MTHKLEKYNVVCEFGCIPYSFCRIPGCCSLREIRELDAAVTHTVVCGKYVKLLIDFQKHLRHF